MTVGSVFGMVTATANAVTGAVTAAADGVSMLDKFVKDASEKQALRSTADMNDFIYRLAEEKAQERSDRQIQVDAFCDRSPRHAELYNRNYTEILALLKKDEKPSATLKAV
jgi:hypothetical protein